MTPNSTISKPTSVVTLLNPEMVTDYLRGVGYFAHICRFDRPLTPEEMPSDKKLRAIGLHCLKANHSSPARAVYFWFNIEHISRVCSHQIVRSSVGVEINQRSQRDCKASVKDNVIPETIIQSPEALAKFLHAIQVAYDAYDAMLAMGIPMEDARYILPGAGCTGMNIAVTPIAFFHMCNERMCATAQWEIKGAVKQMIDQVLVYEPKLYQFMVPKCVRFNGCNEPRNCGYFSNYLRNKREKAEKSA